MPLDRWYPLPCDESGLVDRGVFGWYVQALLGELDPQSRARVLTRTILEQWDRTRDVWWWSQVRVIEWRLEQCSVVSLDRYRAWRMRWIVEQIEIRTRRERHPEILDPGYRSRLRGQVVGWREREKEAYLLTDWITEERCHARADALCQRLRDDAVARWQAGRGGVHPGRRRCAERAYHEACKLGWVPPSGPILVPLPEVERREFPAEPGPKWANSRWARSERRAGLAARGGTP